MDGLHPRGQQDAIQFDAQGGLEMGPGIPMATSRESSKVGKTLQGLGQQPGATAALSPQPLFQRGADHAPTSTGVASSVAVMTFNARPSEAASLAASTGTSTLSSSVAAKARASSQQHLPAAWLPLQLRSGWRPPSLLYLSGVSC